jgi:hypothetical protein
MRWKCLMGGFVLMFLSSGVHAEDSVTEDERQLIRTYLGATFEETLDAAPPLASVMPEEDGIPKFTVPFLQEELEREQTRAIPIGPMPFLECVPSRKDQELIPELQSKRMYMFGDLLEGLPGYAVFTTDGRQFVEYRSTVAEHRYKMDDATYADLGKLEEHLEARGERYLGLVSAPPEITLCEALDVALGLELVAGEGETGTQGGQQYRIPEQAGNWWRQIFLTPGLQLVAHCVRWKGRSVETSRRRYWPWVPMSEAVEREKVWIIYLRGVLADGRYPMGPNFELPASRMYVLDGTNGELLYWVGHTGY